MLCARLSVVSRGARRITTVALVPQCRIVYGHARFGGARAPGRLAARPSRCTAARPADRGPAPPSARLATAPRLSGAGTPRRPARSPRQRAPGAGGARARPGPPGPAGGPLARARPAPLAGGPPVQRASRGATRGPCSAADRGGHALPLKALVRSGALALARTCPTFSRPPAP